MANRKDKVFLDASVILAALGSKTGGSFCVLKLCRAGIVKGLITETILAEAKAHESRVKRASAKNIEELITREKITVLPSPKESTIIKFTNLINDGGRHVIAGATEAGADFLLTLDTRHFFKKRLKEKIKPRQILTPGEFLQEFVR